MKQRFWSGLSAALLTTTLGTTFSCDAQTAKITGKEAQVNQTANASLPSPPTNTQASDVVKEGEYQSQSGASTPEEIAKIHTHELAGSQAATLYVRDIPVLTFVASPRPQAGAWKRLSQPWEPANGIKVGTEQQNASQQVENANNSAGDPVAIATVVAARLNQLNRENIDPNQITVSDVFDHDSSVVKTPPSSKEAIDNNSDPKLGFQNCQIDISNESLTLSQSLPHRSTNTRASAKIADKRYIIKVNEEKLVEINPQTRLPDSAGNLTEDAREVTNRLRRLLGNAPPLTDIPDQPGSTFGGLQIAMISPVRSLQRGIASWYGPGFHGRLSANGERYNQNALTAAHRSLPFGTMVRVTNLRTGLSIVVRITDRGPFVRGRIIDLSASSARAIGVMSSGIAPVLLEVLGAPSIIFTESEFVGF